MSQLRFLKSEHFADGAARVFAEHARRIHDRLPDAEIRHTGGTSIPSALTAIGGLDDLHHGDAWRRIAADQELIHRYNAMKREHEGGRVDDYNAAKRAFFYDTFPTW